MTRTLVSSPQIPVSPGYSPALRAGGLLFISGQVARDAQGRLVGGRDILAQTRQVMDNLTALLQAAGASWGNVVKTNTYTTDIVTFRRETGDLRRSYLVDPPPTSTLVEVSSLADPDFMVEIEAVAIID
ncbi:MAG: RidA family protein [Dehalococcoidia bacterium]